MVKDPVCLMDVDENTEFKAEHKGKRHRDFLGGGKIVKNIMAILAGITLVFGMNILSFGMECGDMSSGHDSGAQATEVKSANNQTAATTSQVSTKETVNVGNKICPVTGEKIDEKTKATYEYNGKVYNFCCAMCIDEFKKDPEKYIKKINEELKTPSQDEETASHH